MDVKSFEEYKEFLERELPECVEMRKAGKLADAECRWAATTSSFLQRLLTKAHTFTIDQIAILSGYIMSYADYGEPYEQNRTCLR